MEINDESFYKLLLDDYKIGGAWSQSNHIIDAADFLSEPNANILDIGSGVGKFCIIAGIHNPATKFTGIELNKKFYDFSHKLTNKLSKKHDLDNVSFINDDFLNLDISKYTGFYLFNPFVMSKNDPNYKSYEAYQIGLEDKLSKMPVGTKLVVNYRYNNKIPDSYEIVENHYKLELLVKSKYNKNKQYHY